MKLKSSFFLCFASLFACNSNIIETVNIKNSSFKPISINKSTISQAIKDISSQEISFQHNETKLSGILALPKGQGPFPSIIFVHGSGPLGRFGHGLYPPIMKHFVQNGFACISWDKPCVGKSSGNWTNQSFNDRADETLTALAFLKGRKEINNKKIGLWGISQGGWICSLAASLSNEVNFIIIVSAPAVDVEEQELFRIKTQMEIDKFSLSDIEKATSFIKRRFDYAKKNYNFEKLEPFQQKIRGENWIDYIHFRTSRRTPIFYNSIFIL